MVWEKRKKETRSRRARRALVLAASFAGLFLQPHWSGAQITATWNSGNADWSNTLNWSGGVVPGSTDEAFFTGTVGTTYTTTINSAESVGTLSLNSSSTNTTDTIGGTAALTLGPSILQNNVGAFDITSSISIAAKKDLNLGGTGTGTVFLGNIVHAGSGGGNTGSLLFDGSATYVLTGTMSGDFSGTTVSSGVFALQGAANAGGFGITVSGGYLQLNTYSLSSDSVALNGGGITGLGASSVTSVTTIGSGDSAAFQSANSGTLTIGNGTDDLTGGSSSSTITVGGNTGFNGVVSLAAASNYAGGWIVSGGSLTIGSSTALGTGGMLTVNSGATFNLNGHNQTIANYLAGAGSIIGGNSTTLTLSAGATLAPGGASGVGTLNDTSYVTFGSGLALNYDLSTSSTAAGGSNNDLFAVTGTMSLSATGGGTLTINPVGTGALQHGTYTLATYTTIAGATANSTLSNWIFAGSGYYGKLSIVAAGTALELIDGNDASTLGILSTPLTLNTRVGSAGSVTSVLTNSSTLSSGFYSASGAGSSLTVTPSTGTVGDTSGTSTANLVLGWGNNATAGAQSATLTVTNLGNAADAANHTVSITGGVYNLATATVASNTASIGNFRVSTSSSGTLTLTNTGSASYQDQLSVANVATGSSVTVSTPAGIIGGGSGNAVYTALSGTAGSLSVLSTLSLASHSTVGLSDVSLGSLTISVVGAGYAYATTNLAGSASTLTFGNVRMSSTHNDSISVTNTAATNATYTDNLVTLFNNSTANTVNPTATSLSLAAGTSNSFSIGLGTSVSGALSEVTTLSLISNGSAEGLDNKTLSLVTYTLTGTAYALATASTTSNSVNVGNFRVGNNALGTLTLTNAGSASFQDNLTMSNVGIGSSVTVATPGNIIGDNSGNVVYTANTGTAGSLSVNNTLALVSNPTVTPLTAVSLGSLTVSVAGVGYAYATSSLASAASTLTFGNVRMGSTHNDSISVTNTASTNATYTDNLITLFNNSSANTVNPLTSSLTLSAGSGNSFSIGLGTSSTGALSEVTTLSLISNGSAEGLDNRTLTLDTYTLTGTAYALATASTSSNSVNVGNFRVGNNALGTLTITNAGSASFQDNLTMSNVGIGSSVTVATPGNIIGGNSGNDVYTANTGTYGNLSVNNTLALVSNPTATPLTTVSLGSLTVSVAGVGYNVATDTIASNSVNVGNFRVGSSALGTLTVTNTSLGSTAYQDQLALLSTGIGSSVSVATSGNITAGAAGNTLYTALTGSYGNLSVSNTLALTSHSTVGLADLSLGSLTVSVAGIGFNKATDTIASSTVNLGNFRVGNSAAGTLTVTNTSLGSTAYQDQLALTSSGIGSSVTLGTLPGDITAGTAGAVTYTATTGSYGNLSVNNTLALTSHSTVGLADLSLGSLTVSVAGIGYNKATDTIASSSINLGNFHVGNSAAGTLTVTNTSLGSTAYQDQLALASTGIGASVSVGAPGNITAGVSGNVIYTANTGAYGNLSVNNTLSLTSHSTVGLADLSLGSLTLSVSGVGFNFATATIASPTVSVGNFRTGAAGSGVLSITNTSLGNTSYQDQLNVTPTGSVTNLSATGFTSLTAGSSGNVNYSASASIAGSVSYQSTLGLFSNPTAANLVGQSLGTATASIVGVAYDYANPVFNSVSNIAFGITRAGTPVSQSLNITNSTISNPLFQDSLSVSGTSSNAAVIITPTASAITAGNSGVVGFGSSASFGGSLAGTTTLALVSTTTVAGLTSTTTTVNVTTTGSAYDYANAQLASTLVNLGASRTGGGSASANLAITNSVVSNASYQDELNVSGSGSSPATVGTITGLAAGNSGNLGFTASLGSAGSLGGTETLSLVSSPTVALSGRTTFATVSVAGGVYDYANPNLATLSLNLGNHHVGDAASTTNLAITNSTVTSASYQDELSVSGSNPSANVSVGSISGLAAGNSSNLGFTVSTGSAGSLAGNSTLALQSVPTVSLTGRTTYATVSVTGGIYNYATGSVASTVNLASAFVSASVSSSTVNVANTSPSSYSDALDAYGSASSGITAGNVTGIAGGNTSTLNVAADTSFAHLGGGTVTVGLVSNGTAEGLGTTSVGSATVSVTGGNVYQHAVLTDPPVTIRLTQGATGSSTYSISDLSSSPLRDSALVSTVTINNANITTTASGMLPTTIAPGSSTVYSVSYASTSSVDSTAGNLAFTYGDLQTGLAGANNNNQTLTVAVNAIVDPIVEVAQLSGSTASINTAPDRIAAGNASGFIGTVAPTYLAGGQYDAGVLHEANMYNATGHAEGVVEVNVAPPTAALEPTTLLLFDFFNGAAETSAQSTDFSELTQDLSTFGYTYNTNTSSGALGFYDNNALYKPTGYTYELEVDLDSGPIAGMNPSQIDFNFSKYGLQVDNLLAVPEPTSMAMLGLASLGILGRPGRPRRTKGK